MNRKFTDYLKDLDLSESEVKIYFTLLETGALSVRALAQKLGFKRTTSYHYIDNLIEKGLLIKLVSGSQTLMDALQPEEVLPYLVEQRVQSGRKMQETLPELLNEIRESFSKKEKSPLEDVQIKYFRGELGVKKIYEDALQSNELRSYANLSIMEGVFPENLHLFSDAFKKNKELKMFEIVEDSTQSRKQTAFSSKNERYFYKFLPKETNLSAADILIYDGKVGIINVNDKITGVILQNNEYYNSSKELFDLQWKGLPEVKR